MASEVGLGWVKWFPQLQTSWFFTGRDKVSSRPAGKVGHPGDRDSSPGAAYFIPSRMHSPTGSLGGQQMLAVSECPGQERASCVRTAVDWGLQTSKLLLYMLYWPRPSADPEKGSSTDTLRFKNVSTQTPVCLPGATHYSKRISHRLRRSHHPPLSRHLGFAKCVSLHKRPLPICFQSPCDVLGTLQGDKGFQGGFLEACTFPHPSFCLFLISTI